MAVASIALIIVRLVISSTTLSTDNLLQDSAQGVTESIRDSIYTQILEDPTSPYKTVLESEYPRQCTIDGDITIFSEGDAWPSSCGTTWSYDTTTQSQGAKISLPFTSDARLSVESSVSLDNYTFGVNDIYTIGGLSRPSSYSGADLDFNSLNAASVSGNAYSTKAITPLVSSYNDLLMAAEEGWTLPPYVNNEENPFAITYLGPDYIVGEEGYPTIFPIRSGYPDPLLPSSFENSLEAIQEISCGSGFSSKNVMVNSTSFSSNVCIIPGYSLMNSTGSLVEIPAASAILITQGSSDDIFDLYTIDDLELPGDSCSNSCNLLEISEEFIADGKHPGSLDSWTKLGSFFYPHSSIAYANFTTFIGLCGEAFLGQVGFCDTFTTSTNLTLGVGSVSSPRKVFLNGSIMESTGHLSVVSSGNFTIPFWATAPATILSIEASLVATGNGATVESYPSFNFTGSPLLPSFFTLQGSLASPDLEVSLSDSVHYGFATVIKPQEVSLAPIPVFEFVLVESEIFRNVN